MNIDYSEIEKLYLSAEEIEYIKHTIINPEIKPGSETLKWFSWRENIARTSRHNPETNHKLVEQYERLIEIDYLFTILKGDFSRTILDLNRKMEYCDKQTQEYDVRVMLENTMIEVETCVYEKELEKILIEEYEQDLEDSFVQELIKQLMNDNEKEERCTNLDRLIKAAGFKHINDKEILSIASLLLKEYNKAKENNKSTFIDRRGVDRKTIAFLILKNLKYAPINLGEINSNDKKKK